GGGEPVLLPPPLELAPALGDLGRGVLGVGGVQHTEGARRGVGGPALAGLLLVDRGALPGVVELLVAVLVEAVGDAGRPQQRPAAVGHLVVEVVVLGGGQLPARVDQLVCAGGGLRRGLRGL